MTREELKEHCEKQIEMCEMLAISKGEKPSGKSYEEHKLILELLEKESCDDAISRQAVLDYIYNDLGLGDEENGKDIERQIELESSYRYVKSLPPVTPQPKTEHCKECKYFEYDSVAKVDGVPLIVAHEICSKWGDGCKTKEDGYCFLFEQKEKKVEKE